MRFTTAEAVAIVHGTCTQVLSGAARALPRQPEDVWITDAGTLEITGPTLAEGPRAAVAALLERLLPPSSDEPAYAVPSSLRTLPVRLRESGDAAQNDVTDLVLILSRYVPPNPRGLLQQLVGRLQRSTRSAEPDPHTSTSVDGHVADLPLQVDGASRPPAHRQVAHNHASLIAVPLLLIAVSGFIGYRLTSDSGRPAPVAATNDTPTVFHWSHGSSSEIRRGYPEEQRASSEARRRSSCR